jgi:hypothetical protein
MRFRILMSVSFLMCLNLCFGQTDTNLKKIILNNLEQESDTEVLNNKKSETIRDLKKIINKENKILLKTNTYRTNGIFLNKLSDTEPTDTLELLKDSINSLNGIIVILKEKYVKLKKDNYKLLLQTENNLNINKEKLQAAKKTQNILRTLLLILSLILIYFLLNSRSKHQNFSHHLKQIRLMLKRTEIREASRQEDLETIIQQHTISSHEQIIQKPNKIFLRTKHDVPPVEYNLPKSFSNICYQLPKKGIGGDNLNWFVVGGSSIGKTHISRNKPCQDNHFCSNIKDAWGIAISCDGAGSADNSQLGSEFVSKKAVEVFKDSIQLNNFVNNNKLPNEEEWQSISNLALRTINKALADFASEKKIEFNTLACTIIVVIFTPQGLLSCHIGDGRAGYCSANGEWKPLITPHKGEEANQTIFITSSIWLSEVDFKMSNVLVPETRIVNEKVIAFTLLSDGCETHSFDCSKMDDKTGRWIDPNSPSEIFFNPLIKQLKSMIINRVSLTEITASWNKFIEEGTAGIKDEPDDKTLILGILI